MASRSIREAKTALVRPGTFKWGSTHDTFSGDLMDSPIFSNKDAGWIELLYPTATFMV